MLVDLHVVVPSDDAAALDGVLAACARAGLDGVCLVGAGAVPPVDAARASASAGTLKLFFGVEFLVERGRMTWIPEDPSALAAAPLPSPATAAAVTALAADHGGLVMASHPYVRWNGPSFSDGIYQMTGLGAVEIANAALDHARNNLALDAALRLRLAAVGGSGTGAGVDEIGAAATVFPEAVADQAGLVAALRRADVFAIELLSTPEQVGELEPEEGPSRGERPERGDRPDRGPRPEQDAGPRGEGDHRRRRRRRGGGRGPGEGGGPEGQAEGGNEGGNEGGAPEGGADGSAE